LKAIKNTSFSVCVPTDSPINFLTFLFGFLLIGGFGWETPAGPLEEESNEVFLLKADFFCCAIKNKRFLINFNKIPVQSLIIIRRRTLTVVTSSNFVFPPPTFPRIFSTLFSRFEISFCGFSINFCFTTFSITGRAANELLRLSAVEIIGLRPVVSRPLEDLALSWLCLLLILLLLLSTIFIPLIFKYYF